MSEDTQWVVLDAAGRVAEDLPCVGCGYNLRTIAAAGQCPECGAAVRRAIWVIKLRWADPKWLRSMSYSVFWLTIGLGVLVASPLLFFWPGTPPLLLMAAMMAVPAVTVVIGAWQATAKEDERRRWINIMRVAARVGVGGGIGVLILSIAVTPWVVDRGGNTGWIGNLMTMIYVSAAAMICVGVVTGLGFAVSVSRRIQHRRLTRFLTVMAVLLAVHALVFGLVFTTAMLLERSWEIEQWLSNWGFTVDMYELLGWIMDWVGEPLIPWMPWSLEVMGLLLLPGMWWYRYRLRDAARMAGRG